MTDKEIANPYLDSRKDFNELYGKEKANASMWRMFGLLNMFITLVAVCGMIYVSQLPDVVPFLFKEDGTGGITALGIPNKELKVDNRIISNQLAIFVEDLRQVPTSSEIKSAYVHRVKMMSSQNLFRNKLAQMLKDEYATNATTSIHVSGVFPIGDTWEVDWTEFKNNISYTKNPIPTKDSTELIWNPMGIIVNDIQINPVIGS